jgi:mono/diheme cytochrome c family protein
MIKRTLSIALSLGLTVGATFLIAVRAAGDDAPAASGSAANQTSLQLVASSPKGSLKDPYIGNKQAIGEGEILFNRIGCSGCHGHEGSGDMCPSLTDGVWIYGGDDDTLIRLVSLGSVNLQKQGYVRLVDVSVLGPMPSMGPAVPNPDDIWKIIAWIRSHYDSKGNPLSSQQ